MSGPTEQAESVGTTAARRALRSTPRLHRWAAMQLERDPLGHGLSLRQLAALLALREGVCPAGRLARQMKVTPAVVTGIADRLERGGFVRREADETDRRRQFLALTERGRAASDELLAVLTADLAARFDALPTEDLAALSRGLAVLERVVGEIDARPVACGGLVPPVGGERRRADCAGHGPPGMAAAAGTGDTDTGAGPRAFSNRGGTAPHSATGGHRMTDTIDRTCPFHADAAGVEHPVHPLSLGHDGRSAAFDLYRTLRAEGPVVRARFEGFGPPEGAELSEEEKRAVAARGFDPNVWLVTTYDEGVAALLDERFSVDPRTTMTPEQRAAAEEVGKEFRPLSRSLLTVDPPDHTRLRKLVQPAFTGRLTEAMRPRIRQIAEELLDRAEAAATARGEAPGERRLELIREFAYPLPVTVISDLIGIPVEDRERARAWSENLLHGRAQRGDPAARQSLLDFIDYLKGLFEQKRRQPGEDLISELVRVEAEGDQLDDDELLSMVFIVYLAGHITTVNLIGNGVYALLTHPAELAEVVADPAGTAKGVVEETLRYYGPAEGTLPRTATEDLTLSGVAVRRGEKMAVSIGSADRDPAKFANAEAFDVSRPDANRHMAFGKGIHVCLGSPLARVEGQVAFEVLFSRYPGMRLAAPADEVRWSDSFIRGLETLPVEV